MLRNYILPIGVSAALCLFSCTAPSRPETSAPVLSSPAIITIYPSETRAGKPFNPQPGGSAAIAVKCVNATKKTVILWDGDRLDTAFGSPEAVTALVPSQYYSKPGEHLITLENEVGKSNPMAFFVRP